MAVFDAYCYLGGSVVPGVASNATVIAEAMEERGVDAAVLLSFHARSVDPIAGNRVLKAMLDQRQSLFGCLVTHVNRVDASLAAMHELMANRKFVAMAVSGMHQEEFAQKIVADDIINAYRRYGKPLYLFTPNAAAVQAGLEIARGFPMLKVVFLGMGGVDWRAAVAAAHSATNIILETSGVLDRAKLPAAVAIIGAHRILFGSGSPRVDAAAALGIIEDSDLSDEARRRILYDNALRLFDLDSGE